MQNALPSIAVALALFWCCPCCGFYSPETGRWLSRDPIEETGALNLYGFVGGNAVSLCDTDGRKKYDFSKESYPFTFSFKSGDVIITPEQDTINVLSGNVWPFAPATTLARVQCLLKKLGFIVPAPKNGVYLSSIKSSVLAYTLSWPGFFGSTRAATFFEKVQVENVYANTSRALTAQMWHEMKGHNGDNQEDGRDFDLKYEKPVYDAWDKAHGKRIPACACETPKGHWIMNTELDTLACECGFER